MNFLPKSPRYQAAVAMAIVILAGIFFRITDLGLWSLAIDEYYFTKSIYNIIDHGLPVFDCGGYYTRGLLQQYLTAPFLLFSSDPEWAVRIVSVIINLCAFPAIYLLAKRLGGYPVAFAAIALFSLSIWEIEFSRFGRMYALFQTLFLWQLVFLMRSIFDRSKTAIIWMYVISALSIITYEGAIFIVILVLIPFITKKHRLTPTHILITLALLFTTVLYLKTDFRHLNAIQHLPQDIIDLQKTNSGSNLSLPITLPEFIAIPIFKDTFWRIIALLPIILSLWAIIVHWRNARTSFIEPAVWSLFILLTIVHQFGMAIEIILLAYLLNTNKPKPPVIRYKLALKLTLLAVTTNGLFWIIYGITSENHTAYEILKYFIKYPDIYTSVIYQWFAAMPVQTVLMILVIAAGLTHIFIHKSETNNSLKLLIAIVIGMAMLIGLIKTGKFSARYSFFIYPVILLLCSTIIGTYSSMIARNPKNKILLMTGFLFGFSIFSEDFNLNHLINIGSPEINFRSIYSWNRQGQLYRRHDYSSPAEFINNNMSENDTIISMVPVIDFYLDKMDYRFINHNDSEFRGISACNGTRELWSNAGLIYNKSDLFELIDNNSKTIWLILYTDHRRYRSAEERILETKYSKFFEYTNTDKTLLVYRIPAQLSEPENSI